MSNEEDIFNEWDAELEIDWPDRDGWGQTWAERYRTVREKLITEADSGKEPVVADQYAYRERKKCSGCGQRRLTTLTSNGPLCNDCLCAPADSGKGRTLSEAESYLANLRNECGERVVRAEDRGVTWVSCPVCNDGDAHVDALALLEGERREDG